MARSPRMARNVPAVAALASLFAFLIGSSSGAQVQLEPGSRAVVVGTASYGLSVREGPGYAYPRTAVIPEQTEVTVMQGPTVSDGMPWYQIADYGEDGAHGWSIGDFLEPKAAAGIPTSDRSGSARGGVREPASFISIVTAYAIRGYTRTGTHTRWGVVAVDPTVIPLGSKLMVEGFAEIFTAEDTGSGVKGKWVDIWFPSYEEAHRFGLQYRRVTVLEP